jgi:oxygen-independent coproporphyrinogen-3 oxidase
MVGLQTAANALAASAGVYVHIPFCAKKCGYCDFNAYSGYKDGTKARYVDAVCREIALRAEPQTRIPTIFFGGGTPTTLSADDLARILAAVKAAFAVDTEAEITIEANPGDASGDYLAALRAAGFNRLSFGVQTFDDRLLKTIDRIHTGDDARRAVALARAAGFDNVSIDLMFALPRQTLADWDRALDAAFALDVPHLSLYGLIVEERTPFWARRERGKLPLPTEEVEAAMFGRAIERTQAAGYRHYEISNYARPGFESLHNQIYWRNEDYFGLGAGAVSYRGGVRAMNERLPSVYIDATRAPVWSNAWDERIAGRELLGETIMVGLRLRSGVDLDRFAARFGVRAEDAFADAIVRFTANGLLEIRDGHLRLTDRGLFFGSDAMAAFLP